MKPPEKMVEKIVASLTDHVRDVLEEELARTVPSVEELGVKLNVLRVENAQLRASMKRILKACPHEDFAPMGCGCRWCVARRMVEAHPGAIGEALEALVEASRAMPAECASCSAKPGAPDLCGACLSIRNVRAALAVLDAVRGA